ncbi:MAG: leucyl/phenylalanyl-tRNA--protein transferase [Lentisphaeria bacterium]|nr:leucyl/phenylalanyl-tRNA--protein transferase [Lentisphaeria bacterium]
MNQLFQYNSATPAFFPAPEELENMEYVLSEEITLSLLADAYFHGYFPWPDPNEKRFVPWAHPLQRGMVLLKDFHIPKNVHRLLKQKKFELRIDTEVEKVIRSCSIRNDGEESWITEEVICTYMEFHKQGFVHSFEAWNRETGTLAGGLYGVSIGGLFAGESMFYRESGSSKFALACLGKILRKCSVTVLDTQMVTPVTESFGAEYIPRQYYLKLLKEHRSEPLTTQALRNAAVAVL